MLANDPTLSAWTIAGTKARNIAKIPLKTRSIQSKNVTDRAKRITRKTELSTPSNVSKKGAAIASRLANDSLSGSGEPNTAATVAESATSITQPSATTLHKPGASKESAKKPKKTHSIQRRKTTARALALRRPLIRSRNKNYIVNDSHPNAQLFKESPPGDKVRPFLTFLDLQYPNPPYYDLRTITGADISAFDEQLNKRAKPLRNETKRAYASGIRAYITTNFPDSAVAEMIANDPTLNSWREARVGASRARDTNQTLKTQFQKTVLDSLTTSGPAGDPKSLVPTNASGEFPSSGVVNESSTQETRSIRRTNTTTRDDQSTHRRGRYDDIQSTSNPQHDFYKPEHAGKSQRELHDKWTTSNKGYKSAFKNFATMVDRKFGRSDFDKNDDNFVILRDLLWTNESIPTDNLAATAIHVRRNPDVDGQIFIGITDAQKNSVPLFNTKDASYSDEATLVEDRLPIDITQRLAMPVFKLTLAQHEKMEVEARALKRGAEKNRRKLEISAGKAFLRDHIAIIEDPELEKAMASAVRTRTLVDNDIDSVEIGQGKNKPGYKILKKIGKARRHVFFDNTHPNADSFRINPPSFYVRPFLFFLYQRSHNYDLRTLTAADIAEFEKHLNEKPSPVMDSTKLNYAYGIRAYVTKVFPNSTAASMIQSNETLNAWIETGRKAKRWNRHHALVDDYINWDQPGIDPSLSHGDDDLMSLGGASRKRKRKQDVLPRPQKKVAAGRRKATKRGKPGTRNQDPLSPYDAAEKNNFAIDPSDLIEPQRFFFDNIEQLRADANLDSIHSNSASMTTPYGDEIGEPLSEAQSAEMSLLQGITSYLHGSRDDSPPIPIDPALLSLDQRNNAQSPAPKQQTGELRRTRDYSAKIGSPLVAGIDKPRRLDGRNRNKNRV